MVAARQGTLSLCACLTQHVQCWLPISTTTPAQHSLSPPPSLCAATPPPQQARQAHANNSPRVLSPCLSLLCGPPPPPPGPPLPPTTTTPHQLHLHPTRLTRSASSRSVLWLSCAPVWAGFSPRLTVRLLRRMGPVLRRRRCWVRHRPLGRTTCSWRSTPTSTTWWVWGGVV